MVRDAVAEAPAHPAREVGGGLGVVLGARVPGVDVAREAVEVGLFRQVAQPVLERVLHPTILEADARVAVATHEGVLTATGHLHPLQRVRVLREQDVPTGDVVREAVDRLAATQPARDGGRFEQGQRVGVESALDERTGEGQAGHTGTEDRDLQGRLGRRRGRGESSRLRGDEAYHRAGAVRRPPRNPSSAVSRCVPWARRRGSGRDPLRSASGAHR